MPEAFDPYYVWLGIPPQEQPANYYRLLGVPLLESKPNVIDNAADRQMAHLRTFQTGPNGRLAERLLNEVAAARVCLLDPRKKAGYDQQLQSRGAAPMLVSAGGEAAMASQRRPATAAPALANDRWLYISVAAAVGLIVAIGIGRALHRSSIAESTPSSTSPPATSPDQSAGRPVLDFVEWSSAEDDFGAKNDFRKDGAEWVELKGGNIWAHFAESDRTSQYVELFDVRRHIWVRLTTTDASWSRDQANWRTTAHGGPVRQ